MSKQPIAEFFSALQHRYQIIGKEADGGGLSIVSDDFTISIIFRWRRTWIQWKNCTWFLSANSYRCRRMKIIISIIQQWTFCWWYTNFQSHLRLWMHHKDVPELYNAMFSPMFNTDTLSKREKVAQKMQPRRRRYTTKAKVQKWGSNKCNENQSLSRVVKITVISTYKDTFHHFNSKQSIPVWELIAQRTPSSSVSNQ